MAAVTDAAALAVGPRRWLLLCVGWTGVLLGLVGAFLPLVPTTPFLLVSAWCFARSSHRAHAWLYSHRRFGPLLRDWDAHGVIPRWAQLLAVAGMTTSFTGVSLFGELSLVALAGMGCVLAAIAAWILTRPARPPQARPPEPGP